MTEHYLQALFDVWEELPELLNIQDWLCLRGEIEGCLENLKTAQSSEEKASITADIALAVRRYGPARERMRMALQDVRQERSADGTQVRVPDWGSLMQRSDQCRRPDVVTRYADISAPRRLGVGERRTVSVGLNLDPNIYSLEYKALEVEPEEELEVVLFAEAGLAIQGSRAQRLRILPELDTPPVTFYLTGEQTGKQALRIDFQQQGFSVGEVRLCIKVVESGRVNNDLQRTVEAIAALRQPMPEFDLSIRIALSGAESGKSLRFTLHSPNGKLPFSQVDIPGKTFVGSAEQFHSWFQKKIEGLHGGREIDRSLLLSEEVEDKLEGLGRDLYEELLPPELRAEYPKFRQATSVLIHSDEPWIPWELVKPYDDSDPDKVIDDKFFCEQFRLTRWLSGRKPAPGEVNVRRLACVEGDLALSEGDAKAAAAKQFAAGEREAVAMLARRSEIEDASPSEARFESIEALLRDGGLGLLHVIAHGQVEESHPDEAWVQLARGQRRFCASDLQGPLRTQIGRDRPLVFFNACSVGRLGFSLTGLGGWASRWVQKCGCGCFVAPMWPVNSRLAMEFAQAFYEQLEDGATFGEAAHAARLQARDKADQGSSRPAAWLAFSVYAHPNGKLVLGGGGMSGDSTGKYGFKLPER